MYFKLLKRTVGAEDPMQGGKILLRTGLKEKGGGAKSIRPASDSRFALSDVLLSLPDIALIRQTEPCGP